METRKTSELRTNPLNPRGEVAHDMALRELAASIREQGVLQPVVITPNNVIVAGHRRVRAAALADIREVPVVVKSLTDSEQLQIMLIENLQREGLTVLQTARAYQMLIQYGLKVPEIAKAIGLPKESVNRFVDILNLTPEVHKRFDGENALPLSAVPILLRLNDQDQARIAKMAVEQKWTVATLTRTVNAISDAATRKPRAASLIIEPLAVATRLEREYETVKRDPRMKMVAALLRQAIESLFDLNEKSQKQKKTA